MKKVDPSKITSHNNPKRMIFWKKYKNAKRRCENPARHDYVFYGGRGIKFLWKTFDEFTRDMYDSYLKHVENFGDQRGTTLERIDNNGHYCKENCRWATMGEQAKNKNSNKVLEYNGEKMLMIDWCKRLKLEYATVKYRIAQGWPVEEAFERPRHYKRKALLKIK